MPIRRPRKIVTDPAAVAREERALAKLRDEADALMLKELKQKVWDHGKHRGPQPNLPVIKKKILANRIQIGDKLLEQQNMPTVVDVHNMDSHYPFVSTSDGLARYYTKDEPVMVYRRAPSKQKLTSYTGLATGTFVELHLRISDIAYKGRVRGYISDYTGTSVELDQKTGPTYQVYLHTIREGYIIDPLW